MIKVFILLRRMCYIWYVYFNESLLHLPKYVGFSIINDTIYPFINFDSDISRTLLYEAGDQMDVLISPTS